MKKKLLAYTLLLLTLSGCVSLQPTKQAAENKTLSWSARRQELQAVRQWTINGAFGVRTPKKSLSANLYWRQVAGNYTLRLIGPLGGGRLLLKGSKQRVTMSTGDNKTASAASADALLQNQTGWSVPISSLYYWVRGLPTPGAVTSTKFDKYNHLSRLQQGEWRVVYKSYTAVNKIDLPSFMVISGPNLQVRIAIKQWRL